MYDRDSLMQEIVQISREHQAADDSVTKVAVLAVAIFLASLCLIFFADLSFQTKWGLLILVTLLGFLAYFLAELVNHALSIRSNLQKTNALLTYFVDREK
jgi:putative copper export protein